MPNAEEADGGICVVTIPGRPQEIQKKSKQEKSAVAHMYPNRELDLNDSVLVAVYRVLRRQPWKAMALRTWDTLKRFLQLGATTRRVQG
jgi:hypothetical protein